MDTVKAKKTNGFSDLVVALKEKVKDSDADIRTLVLSLPRACGLNNILENPQSVSDEEINEHIKKVHKVFGSPGDWGYETPIGVALIKIYGLIPE